MSTPECYACGPSTVPAHTFLCEVHASVYVPSMSCVVETMQEVDPEWADARTPWAIVEGVLDSGVECDEPSPDGGCLCYVCAARSAGTRA
jgi:hypothetical protein